MDWNCRPLCSWSLKTLVQQNCHSPTTSPLWRGYTLSIPRASWPPATPLLLAIFRQLAFCCVLCNYADWQQLWRHGHLSMSSHVLIFTTEIPNAPPPKITSIAIAGTFQNEQWVVQRSIRIIVSIVFIYSDQSLWYHCFTKLCFYWVTVVKVLCIVSLYSLCMSTWVVFC